MTASHNTIWVVRLAEGGNITTVQEAAARRHHETSPGSTLSYRPFPSEVKMPFISSADYSVTTENGVYTSTHLPTGASGSSDDMREAYSAMLRAVRDHLERETETVVG